MKEKSSVFMTILATLQIAEFNVNSLGINLERFQKKEISLLPLFKLQFYIKQQLYNTIRLLEKGYSGDDSIDDLLDKYGDIENVPEKAVNKKRKGG